VSAPIFVLGGHQTDFARQWTREGKGLPELCAEAAQGALAASRIGAREIQVGHVGNFAGELYSGQGHLGGLLVEADPAFVGLPTSRHEAACASGSVAVLAAMADLEAGRYDAALVLGVELMRTMSAFESQQHLGAAAWVPRETEGVAYPWPQLFSDLGDEYERRYGLDRRHLTALARKSFANAKRNPNAQTRGWKIDDASFGDDPERNPVVAGRIRRHDCSQVTDGAVAVVLASPRFAADWAAREGEDLARLPRIRGFGHRTARFAFADKLAASRNETYVFPQVRGAIEDAFRRSGVADVSSIDCIETHDCFTTTEYMAIDHFGLTPPGESWRAIEEGVVELGGKRPVNPSGGLMGCGHPVGASGVRMLLDVTRQVRGEAGAMQVEGARTAATLNIGGSATTTVCFVVGRDPRP
jgi:acetyl-CoA C-acetyltransferase